MPTETQTPQNILSTFTPFGPPVLSAHGFPKRVLLASVQPFTQEFIDATHYPESAAQWLTDLLNLLGGIVNRSGDLSRPRNNWKPSTNNFQQAWTILSMVSAKMKITRYRQQ